MWTRVRLSKGVKMLNKQIVALATALMMLLSTTVSAVGTNPTTMETFWDDLGVTNLQDNTVGYQKYIGANGENVYAVGGSLTLKRTVTAYPQLFHIEGPQISASCSGISFKGMFASVVNWDEMEEQFKESGESFAYGILVGIIYSLPGIGEIFTKLDAWAKKIQQMLANACRSGVAIGKQLGGQVNDAAGDDLFGLLSSDSKIKEVGKSYGDGVDKVDKFFDCASQASDWIANGYSCDDAQDIAKTTVLGGYLSSPSIAAAATYSFFEQEGVFPIDVAEDQVVAIDFGTGFNLTSGADSYYDVLAMVALITATTGEVVVPDDVIKTMSAAANKVIETAGAEDAQRKAALKEAASAARGIATDKACKIDQAGRFSKDVIADYFLFGNNVVQAKEDNSTLTETQAANLVKSLAPHTAVIYKSKPAGAFQPQITMMVSGEKTSSYSTQTVDRITNYGGVTQAAQLMKRCYLDEDNASCGSTFTLFDDDEARYMAKIYKNTEDPSERAILSTGYVDYVTYHMAYAISVKIRELIVEISSATKSSVSLASSDGIDSTLTSNYGHCVVAVQNNLRDFAEVYDQALEKFVNKHLKGNVTMNQVHLQFEAQNSKNMQRALQKLQRK